MKWRSEIIGRCLTDYILSITTYRSILSKLTILFGDRELGSLNSEEIFPFIHINQQTKQLTKHTRRANSLSSSASLPKTLNPPSEIHALYLCYRHSIDCLDLSSHTPNCFRRVLMRPLSSMETRLSRPPGSQSQTHQK